MSFRFQLGLVGHFLADYALLYVVIARAQAAGGAKGAVWTFLATSLPALALFALAPLWDRMQRRPLRHIAVVQVVVVLAAATLFATRSLAGTLAIALLLGFTRQLFRLLLGAVAKSVNDPSRQNLLLERSITLRYACMIPGATIGAMAGGSSWEPWILGAASAATLLSLGLLQSDASLREARLHHEVASLPQLPSWRLLSEAFGGRELTVFLFTMLAVSCFMAVEYPLLTESYRFERWMLPIVWGGHLAGSLLASLPLVAKIETTLARTGSLIARYAIASVVAFGLFSVCPPWVAPAAILMATATLLLCRFEIAAGKRLLERVGEARFARANLQMRGFELGLQIAGPALASLGVLLVSVRATLGVVAAACALAIASRGRWETGNKAATPARNP
jgi:hypothetical protein